MRGLFGGVGVKKEEALGYLNRKSEPCSAVLWLSKLNSKFDQLWG